MSTQHTTLSSALVTIEQLISQGFSSFKLYRSEGKVWNVIVNAVQAHSANTLKYGAARFTIRTNYAS